MTCRGHLAGDAQFTVASDSPTNAGLEGTIIGGNLKSGPGDISIKISLEGADEPLRLDLINAELSGKVTESSITSGVINGAVPIDDIENEILPAISSLLTRIIEEECTIAAPECCEDPMPEEKLF